MLIILRFDITSNYGFIGGIINLEGCGNKWVVAYFKTLSRNLPARTKT
jgi:hypothetical protein